MRVRWNKNSILSFVDSHIIDYPTPINLNYMWSFGSTAGLCLVIQIITGIFLAMHYTPHIDLAFSSVEHIMRDVNNGWLIRYLHANGASMFFLVVYCHIFRGLYYGSYMNPRGLLWCSGVLIFVLMMATAFIGYVLPWGQMSFWGATVITNLFSAIPVVGGAIVEWLWGGFSVDNATLNRFFSLHYLLPFAIAGVTVLHLSLLHTEGSNNPLGINTNVDTVSFYPYFYVKDLFSFLLLVALFSFFVFYYPNTLGHSDNYIPANPLVTPAHIVPEWYFLPFYAILRSIPDKLGGVVAMGGAIAILALLPIINTSEIRSSKFRPIFGFAYWFIFADFLLLGWIGQKPVETPFIEIGQVGTVFYFLFFLVLLPLIGLIEKSLVRNNTKG
jgi:ubiquinol-cytochrome c reductase cytochrome b subunit